MKKKELVFEVKKHYWICWELDCKSFNFDNREHLKRNALIFSEKLGRKAVFE